VCLLFRYAPRKPKYFNRIHTGYEWNKYNQTHYDTENPPPKVVQGYKFNIFYPDLLDRSVPPTYRWAESASQLTCSTVLFAKLPCVMCPVLSVAQGCWTAACGQHTGGKHFHNSVFCCGH
jgi:hypothetical protein